MKTNLNKQYADRSSNSLVSDYLTKVFSSKQRLMARVDSIFENGFNLIFQNQLIFVGKDSNQLSAFGLSVPTKTFIEMKNALVVGQQVRIKATFTDKQEMDMSWTIYTKGKVVQIDMDDVGIVDTTLPKISIDYFLADDVLKALQKSSIWQGSGFATTEYLKEKYNQLIEKWDNELAQALIGAGIGLTPSGDDFLQGFMMMELVTGENQAKLTQTIKKALDHRSTTKVSENYYRVLLKGHVNYAWTQLFEAVYHKNMSEIENIISDIQEYGATSGNDILLGVLTFLKVHQDTAEY